MHTAKTSMKQTPDKKPPAGDAGYAKGGQVGSTCDERADKPGVRGMGAARYTSMKYKDE